MTTLPSGPALASVLSTSCSHGRLYGQSIPLADVHYFYSPSPTCSGRFLVSLAGDAIDTFEGLQENAS
jgi:hypothetical protein